MEPTVIEHIIDCDVVPISIQDGGFNTLQVREHQKGGKFKFDASQVILYVSDMQKSGCIDGKRLRKELAGRSVLNVNVLDYLLANPHLIPEEWKDMDIFFWGTLYSHMDSQTLYVRYLHWDGSRWFHNRRALDRGWDVRNPVALGAR